MLIILTETSYSKVASIRSQFDDERLSIVMVANAKVQSRVVEEAIASYSDALNNSEIKSYYFASFSGGEAWKISRGLDGEIRYVEGIKYREVASIEEYPSDEYDPASGSVFNQKVKLKPEPEDYRLPNPYLIFLACEYEMEHINTAHLFGTWQEWEIADAAFISRKRFHAH